MMDKIKRLIENRKIEVVVIDGEEKIRIAPTSQLDLDFVKTNKDAIIAEIKAIEVAKAQRETNIKAIEGLEEIKRVSNEWARYHHEYNRRFEAEDYRALAKPETTVEELKNRYPRAAAYLKAQSWARSDNVGKYEAGKAALERIIAGEDHEQVLAEMETVWSEYVQERMWD